MALSTCSTSASDCLRSPLISQAGWFSTQKILMITSSRSCNCGSTSNSSVPAPEASHAVKGAIDVALKCKEEGSPKTILFNLCGHGFFDMQAYIDYFAGNLKDLEYGEGELAMALSGLPSVA